MNDAPDERDVFFFDLPVVELPCELRVCAIVLGDHHQSGRPAIEAMNDSRPQLASDSAQIGHLVEQRVDKRSLRVAGGGMHHHASRLVHDDNIGVLVHDVEVEVLWFRRGARRLRDVYRNRFPRSHDAIGGNRLPRDGDLSVFDEPLDLGTRMAGEHARQKPIDAYPGLVCRDRDLVARHVRQAARLAAFAGSGEVRRDK